MTKRKILLTGPAWFGDLLPYCEHALVNLGWQVKCLPVNQAPGMARSRARIKRWARVPVVGHRLGHRQFLWQKRQLEVHVNPALGRLIEEWRPEVLLSLLCWGDPLQRTTIESARPVHRIGWLMDDPFGDDAKLVEILGAFDAIFTVDESWNPPIRLLTRHPVETVACGANPEVHFKIAPSDVPPALRSEIVFVGSSYGALAAGQVRRSLLRGLANLGLKVYGDADWRADPEIGGCYAGGPIDTRETNLAYNGAKLAVNIHHPQFRAGTSLRTFAISATGVCQLVDWRPGLEQFLEPEREIVTYRSPEELCDKARFYLAHDSARQAIGRAGRERVLRDHTYTHRLRRVLRDVAS